MLSFADGVTRLGGRAGFQFPASLESYDPDAIAVFDAIEATGATLTDDQKDAANTLITSLKSDGTWSLIRAAHGHLGGTAGAHAINWKNPGTDITWQSSGGMTFDSSGTLGDGTGYGDCNIQPADIGDAGGFSVYVNSMSTGDNKCPIGTKLADNSNSYLFIFNDAFGQYYCFYRGAELAQVGSSPTAGFFSCNRLSNTSLRMDKNGASVATETASVSATALAQDFYLFAENPEGAAMKHFNGRIAFDAVHDAMTEAQSLSFYTAVQAFQAALGRQV